MLSRLLRHLDLQNGRLYGSLIDMLNRGAPVALLAIGMTLVIATAGIDLSVGAVMAICRRGCGEPDRRRPSVADRRWLLALGAGLLCGLWNGVLVAIFGIQPIVATLILMVAGRGIAQLITEGASSPSTTPALIWFGSRRGSRHARAGR